MGSRLPGEARKATCLHNLGNDYVQPLSLHAFSRPPPALATKSPATAMRLGGAQRHPMLP